MCSTNVLLCCDNDDNGDDDGDDHDGDDDGDNNDLSIKALDQRPLLCLKKHSEQSTSPPQLTHITDIKRCRRDI